MVRYQFIPDRSTVTIDAASSLHPIHSSSDGLEGWVDLDVGPGGEVSSSAATVGTLTFPVSKLRSGNAMEDRELYRRVDVRRYPTIEGFLDTIDEPAGDGTYRVSGRVTFKGVTRLYEHVLSIGTVDHRTVELTGSSTFDIREFGMEPPKVLMLKVHPVVTVGIDVVAERKGE